MRTGHEDITDRAALPQHFPRLDKICDEFESAWLAGKEPRIEDFIAGVDEAYRTDLLKELLLAEWQLREQNGQPVEVNSYAERFPANKDLIAELDRERRLEERSTSSADLQVRCPHCRSRISLDRDTPITDITCTSCGGHFSLVNEERETRGARTLERLGQYELVELLGHGGFGSVWKARDTELDRTVAVKVPRRGELTPKEVEQFLREARAVAQLRHPNIVSVHEVGRDGDTVFIVTDLVRGVTLDDWLTAKQPTFREVAALCAKIADALHHAHEAGVIHRDLKPRNILMARGDPTFPVDRREAMVGRDESGPDEPVLMDFGLARRETGEVTVTLEGQVLGTPAYMSPEQARGEAHQADRRTDLYSLGVILFELLTGELPSRGATRMLLHQVVHDEPRHPRSLNDRIPKDLETICLKAMAKEPSRRYTTAAEFAEDLRRHLRGEPIQARLITRAARA